MERISLKGKYISITERNGRKSFGGSQEWYPGSVRQNVKGQGCGLIGHQENGYVAALQDAADLAQGIYYVLAEADQQALSQACLHKVTHCYSQQSVANRYIEEYQKRLQPLTMKR